MNTGEHIENLIDSPERKKEIPMTYFVGRGGKDTGIVHIRFSDLFLSKGGGEIQSYMLEHSPENDQKIKDLTGGFSRRNLNHKIHELLELYKGKKDKKEVTFEFQLF